MFIFVAMNRLIPLFFILATVGSYAQNQSLKLASDIWPPFTDVSSEKGIALDLVELALSRGGIQIQYTIVEFEEVVSGIEAGHFEGSAALWINEDREKSLIFSESYLQNQLILVGKKGTEMKSSLSELGDSKVGVIENYAYGDSLYVEKDLEIIYGKSNQQNLESLLAGELDYILVDALLIQYLLKYQLTEAQEYLEIGKSPVIIKTLHLALSKNVENAAGIIDNFNKEIEAMLLDGSYNDILELNWISADVDGDGTVELVLKGDKAGVSAPQSIYNIYYTDQSKANRYYINGQFYNTWEEIPQKSKIQIPKVQSMDPGKGEMRIRLK